MDNTDTPTLPQPTHWLPTFLIIWIGQQFSLIGSIVVQFALVWWLTQKTGSATVLAGGTIAAVLPGVVVGPFAGTLVDRWNRRRVMMAADSMIAVVAVGLALLFWTGTIQVWHIYAALLIRSVGDTFHWPAMQASTSLMVPEKHLARIAGLNQASRGALGIVGPMAGAFLVSVVHLPAHWIMTVDIFTAMLAVGSLALIAVPQPPSRQEAVKTSFWADMGEGFRYMWNWPGAMVLLVMAMLINFVVNPAFSLMPILVTKYFGKGAIELGSMDSVSGVGVVIGGLILGAWGGFRRRVLTTLVGLIGMGIGTAMVGLVPAGLFPLALVAMFILGVMNPITNGPVMALLQALVPPEMQGRVFNVVQAAAMAMMPLSLAVAGPVSDAIGVQAWYIFGGLVCALMGVAGFFIPALLHIEDRKRPGQERMEAGQESRVEEEGVAVSAE